MLSALLAAGVLGLAAGLAGVGDAAGPAALALIPATALAVGGAAAWVAHRGSRSLQHMARVSSQIGRDELQGDQPMPLEDCCDGARLLSVQLRRLVEVGRQRIRTLEAANAALSGQLASRTQQLTSLQDLSVGLARKSDLVELADEALGALQQTIGYRSASLWGREGGRSDGQVTLLGYRVGEELAAPPASLQGMRLSRANLQRYERIERERESVIENDARQGLLSWLWEKVSDDARTSELYRATRSWMATPLVTRDEVVGVLRVDHSAPAFFDDERVRLLNAVGSQTALAMHHTRVLSQQREMAVMAERNRIARELHDAVSQTLFAANMIAGSLAGAFERGQPPAAEALSHQLRTLSRLNRGALAEMRLLMFELRPDAMEKVPMVELLRPVLEAIACRDDLVVESDLAKADPLSPAQRQELYRMAQEALSNASRHAGARHLRVQLRVRDDGPVELVVADDGRGFDPAVPRPGHFGLGNLRSRADQLGAQLEIRSAPGEGTQVTVSVPMAAQEESRDG